MLIRYFAGASAICAVSLMYSPSGEAETPRLSHKVIVSVERAVRHERMKKFAVDLNQCVRAYTVEIKNGKPTGIGIIVFPGRGFGAPPEAKLPNIVPYRLKPGYYVVRPDQMPIVPLTAWSVDLGMIVVRFDPITGRLYDN